MSERDWTGELEREIQKRVVDICAARGRPLATSVLRINPPLGSEEAKYFQLGLEAGLFRIDELGHVHSELFSASDNGSTSQGPWQLFQYDFLPIRLWRERICLLATASSLILKRGWLGSHVLIDPGLKDKRDLPYGIDILVTAPAGRVYVAVGVKRSPYEIQKLMTDLGACCKRGSHNRDDCGFPQNHPKYEFCASFRPAYFWAVCPDTALCAEMAYDADSISMEALSSLPPRSLVELL